MTRADADLRDIAESVANEARSYLTTITEVASGANPDASLPLLLLAVSDILAAGARLIDATKELCSEKTCYAERDGVVNFFDDNHLSATLSRRLGRYFEETVDAVTEEDS